jgi:hypothetical protein
MAIYRLKGTAGELINRVFTLEDRLLIGRADDCDVRIAHASVAPHHAEVLRAGDGGVLLRDLGSAAGTRVNGEVVTQARLSSGDEVQVAQCRLMLQAPGLRPERVLTGAATRPHRRHWPWLLAVALVMAGLLAWQQGWLSLLLALAQR